MFVDLKKKTKNKTSTRSRHFHVFIFPNKRLCVTRWNSCYEIFQDSIGRKSLSPPHKKEDKSYCCKTGKKKQNNPEYVRPGVCFFFSFLRRKNNKEKQSTLIIFFIFYRFQFFLATFFFSLVVARVCCCEMAKSLLYITRPQVLHTHRYGCVSNATTTPPAIEQRPPDSPRLRLYDDAPVSSQPAPVCVFFFKFHLILYTSPPPSLNEIEISLVPFPWCTYYIQTTHVTAIIYLSYTLIRVWCFNWKY